MAGSGGSLSRFAPRTLIASSAITVGVVVVGVLMSSAPAKQATPPPAPTSLPTTIHRASFCDRVPESALETALGGPITGKATYGPGETETVADGVKDIVDEFSCTWVGPAALNGSASVQAWLFAPPVTTDQASTLAADLPKGCQATVDGFAFGSPTSEYSCKDGTIMLRGLFGDGWLSCEMRVPATDDGAGGYAPAATQVCAAIARAADS